MEQTLILLAVAISPAFLLLGYFWHKDKGEKEPMFLMRRAFLWGILIVIPIGIVEVFLEGFANGFFPEVQHSLPYLAFSMYALVALPEEAGKLWVVKRKVYQTSKFNEIMDGITYAVLAAMGFAVFENILYVFQYGLGTGILRAFTAVPAHALFSGIMGYYIGMAKFEQDKEKEKKLLKQGLLAGVFFHGTYNTLLSTGAILPGTLLPLLVFPLLIYMWAILHRTIKMANAGTAQDIKYF